MKRNRSVIAATVSGLASIGFALPALADGVLAFDDAYADLGDNSDPATYYDGVTISGTYSGVWGGVSNGDPGSWDLDGTNGPAFLGMNSGSSAEPTFTFDQPVSSFSIDIGNSGLGDNDYTITAYLDGVQVDQQMINIVDVDDTTGVWETVTFNQVLDSVVVELTSFTYFAFGIDNIIYTSLPQLGPSGPDTFGYTGNTTAYNLRDVQTTGTQIASFSDDDVENIPIGFDFDFYGNTYSTVNVSSNGFLSFTNAINWCCNGEVIPGNGPENAIFAAWTDLDPTEGGAVFYETRGAAPNRELVVGFYDVQHNADCCSDPTISTFEVILHETSNTVELQYETLTWESFGFGNPDFYAMTIGIQNGDLTDGLQLAFYDPPIVSDIVVLSEVGYAITPPIGRTGPDSSGYYGDDYAYNLRDISSTGTQGPTGDDDTDLVPIGFDFTFYGATYDEVHISSNGFLSFTNSSPQCCAGLTIPGNGSENLIAAAWNDFDPTEGGNIYYETLGVAPNREFIVGFYDVQHNLDFFSDPSPSTFEIILHEGSNNIEFQYAELLHESFDGSGAQTSIGIQNNDLTDGIQIDFATTSATDHSVLHNNRGYIIKPCILDIDGSGTIDLGDLLAVISGWGSPGPADIDGSGTVDLGDLLAIISNWGGNCLN